MCIRDSSWCGYRKMECGAGPNYIHKKAGRIPYAILNAVKPIYRDLSNPSLLARCIHGKTQNVNESFNNLIWTRIPKNVFVRLQTLQLGVYDAVGVFNCGNIIKCKVLKKNWD